MSSSRMNSMNALNTSLPSINQSNIALMGGLYDGSSTVRYPQGTGSETGRNYGYREPQSLNLDDLMLKNPGFAASMRTSPR